MRKSYFALLLLLLTAYGCSKDEWSDKLVINDVIATDFGDAQLYRYMQVNYDKNNDGIFQKDEILAVKSLLIQEQLSATSLKGLEKFVALEQLDVQWIKTIDDEKIKISNPRLRILTFKYIGGELDITELSELEVLKHPAGLYELDFSNHKKLRELSCMGRGKLIMTNNTELEKVECANSIIDSIDLSKCTKLQHLSLDNTRFDSLDISNCINLKYLNINSWDLKKPVSISNNKNLEEIHVNGREYFTLDITQNLKIKKIYIAYTPNNQPYIILLGKNQTKPEVETRLESSKYEFQYK